MYTYVSLNLNRSFTGLLSIERHLTNSRWRCWNKRYSAFTNYSHLNGCLLQLYVSKIQESPEENFKHKEYHTIFLKEISFQFCEWRQNVFLCIIAFSVHAPLYRFITFYISTRSSDEVFFLLGWEPCRCERWGGLRYYVCMW